jgi:hypothetical protein
MRITGSTYSTYMILNMLRPKEANMQSINSHIYSTSDVMTMQPSCLRNILPRFKTMYIELLINQEQLGLSVYGVPNRKCTLKTKSPES